MTTEINQYKDMSQLSGRELDAVITQERESFGYRPYGEYSFCSSEECRRIVSIDEAFGVSDTNEGYKPLEELENGDCTAPDCPDCGSPTIVIFNPQIYRPLLKEVIYPTSYGSVLTDETGAVRGNCVFQNTNARDFFESANYKERMQFEDFRRRASEVLGIDIQDDTDVVSTNRISALRQFRKRGGESTFMQLGRSTFNLRPDNDEKPGFASVSPRGNVLPVLHAMGYEPILEDDAGTLLIGVRRLGTPRDAFNLPADEFRRKLGPAVDSITKKMRIDNTAPPEIKYYKGATIVGAMQEAYEKANPGVEAPD